MTDTPELLAWIGEDQCGSGEVGIKPAQVAAGIIPIVAVDRDKDKIIRPEIIAQFQVMADLFGKPIRLVRYVPVEELHVVVPRGHVKNHV